MLELVWMLVSKQCSGADGTSFIVWGSAAIAGDGVLLEIWPSVRAEHVDDFVTLTLTVDDVVVLGPHLIYRNEYFGAPVRNSADTVWMKEREIAAMYRARFDEQRRSTAAIDALYAEAAAGRDTANRAWLIAVAHPRILGALVRPTREEAQAIFRQAEPITLSYSNRNVMHPLENVNRLNPRPGLRRWVAPNNATGDGSWWWEAWASVHHDGSVTVAAAVGAHRKTNGGNQGGITYLHVISELPEDDD
ncbi:hypothetical protein [Mycobacterium sp. 141]|uniref:hypothetical protein n=1 Tax=Mycobacterium sp. 141 TaxID=1120797 RepID=UPI00035FD989|nr:hypothetical protein [Mycobacterium sp. 141]